MTAEQTAFPFDNTLLWRTTLAEMSDDPHKLFRDRLRVAFLSMRVRSEQLANTLPDALRELTVHDITHSDALWETADLITGPLINFNPLEGFILGCAFLLHDLGMGLAAYPDGLKTLEKHQLWCGLIKLSMREITGSSPSDEALNKPPDEAVRRVQFTLLRLLHAERARLLVDQEWTNSDGEFFHLLEDKDLRTTLGEMIGTIAHSHWWPLDKVASTFSIPQGPPPPFPAEWTIDRLKIALALRLADAAHIDARRAPPFLRVLRRPEGESELHWVFQERLNKVQLDRDRLRFTGRAFSARHALAWWLCVDTLRMIDDELRQVDNLLSSRNSTRFSAHGVYGVEDPAILTKLIPAEGWTPVDAKVHIGNVPSLVQKLGGEELYGENGIAPLRELLQNAIDAVRARRVLEGDPDQGSIVVRVGVTDNRSWIEVEDDGIGMSPETLTGAFLDFGKSFWGAQESVIEFPMLAAATFNSIGRFGIGFFSVFMWGTEVTVTSRRYDRGFQDGYVLDFSAGVNTRPILRAAMTSELLPRGGTRVRAWLNKVADPMESWMATAYPMAHFVPNPSSPRDACDGLVGFVDVPVTFEYLGKKELLVSGSKWKSWSTKKLALASDYYTEHTLSDHFHQFIKPVVVEGRVVAKAAVVPYYSRGWILVGGIKSETLSNFLGAFEGEPQKASRETSMISIPRQELMKWAEQQRRQIEKYYSKDEQFGCSRILAELGASTKNLYIAKLNDGTSVRAEEITAWARNLDEIILINSFQEDRLLANLGKNNWASNSLIEPSTLSINDSFINAPRIDLSSDRYGLPATMLEKIKNKTLLLSREEKISRPVLAAIGEAWNTKPENLMSTRFRETNIAQSGRYILDGTEIVLRNPLFCPDCGSPLSKVSNCCKFPDYLSDRDEQKPA